MSPNFEYIAAVLDDYCDMQTSGFIPTANRYPVADIQEQVDLLGQLEPASNAVLANRIAELERDVSMHRNAEIMWEKTMMQAVGEDGPSDVIKAIDKIKAERDAALAQVESQLDDRKAFVKKEFELLKEIERLEIELKKRDEQNAALAAQVAELSRFISVYEELQKLTPPKQNLAEIRAEAIEQAATYLSESMPDKSHESVIFKDGYVYISTRYLREHAETIRQGGAA